MSRRVAWSLAFWCLFVCTNTASAQTTSISADIEGVVTDQSGARLPGATVDVVNDETGIRYRTIAESDGRFAVRALPVGPYHVAVSFTGFEQREAGPITLSLGAPAVLEFVLKVAGQRYDVEVQAERARADTQRPGLGGVVDRSELDHLPVDVRNFLAFSLLIPGSAPDRTPQQGASRTSGLVFSGQRARANNIVVDGLDNNDQVVGSVRAVFSQEAVQEFQVLTNGFSAEFGKASGGVVNIVTRSGTNEPKGSAFLYFRDESIAARNYFEQFTPAGAPIDPGKAPYERSQFGLTFGGPIVRNRTFAFGSIERLVANASNFVTIDGTTQVPDPTRPGATFGSAVDILRRAGFPVETGHVPYRLRSTQWLLKFNHEVRPGQQATLRLNGATELNENIEPFGGLIARSRAAALDNTDLMIGGSYTMPLGSRVFNDTRVLIARRDQDVQALDPVCEGPCDQENEGGPTLEIAGVASVGRQRFTPTPRDDTRYQIVDTISYARTTHLFKAGVDSSVIVGRRQALPLHFGGRYIFQSLSATISSVQALALGLPAAYVQGYGESAFTYNTGDVALFVDDTWTPRTGLSVRYGLRYQRQFWPDIDYHAVGIANPYAFPSDRNDFAPRFSVAWSPASSDTVLRGGYGLYYDDVLTAAAGVAHSVSGLTDGIRTLVLTAPVAFAAWAAPGHRLSEGSAMALFGGSFPSVTIPIDPGLKTSSAHQVFAGIERRLGRKGTAALTASFARGFNELGTIDYNPVVPALGPRRRPADLNGVAGTSASVLQYTSFGETWYRGLTASLESRPVKGTALRVIYTLSKAEDTSTDFQTAFLPQDNGSGRDPAQPTGLPIGFRPELERGPALHDQRHRLVITAVSELPGAINVSTVVNSASGWPYNELAGVDLNGDADGGAFPSDRPRRDPANPASSIKRNSGRLTSHTTVDLRVSRPIQVRALDIEPVLDVLNLFNRANFINVQNIFGSGAYPSQPSSTFGQFTQAAPGRQLQIGLRLLF